MSIWFSRHADWLASQSYALSHCSSYREKYQTVGRTLVSCGEVVIRTLRPWRSPVFIVFPSSTPFLPPTIIPVSALPDEAQFHKLGAMSPEHIIEALQPRVAMMSERHQMSDGSLCLVGPEESLQTAPRLVDVGDAIRRAVGWFAGSQTGHFPPDTQQVELFAHMPHKDDDLHILLTDIFDDGTLMEGDFYLASSYHLPEEMLVGVALLGPNKAGIDQWLVFDTPSRGQIDFFSPVVPDPVELAKGDSDAPGGNALRTGKWWALDREPKPFGSVDELAAQASDSVSELSRIAKALDGELRKGAHAILAAVRYNNRDGKPEWQFLRLERPAEMEGVLLQPALQDLVETVRQYKVVALRSSRVVPETFFLRNAGRLSREVLERSHVIVLGLGALGSEVSDCIAKAGVGHLTIVDHDKLELGNVVRHLAGIDGVGKHKVAAVGFRLMFHNPYAMIDVEADATKLDWSALEDGAISVSTIADDNTESLVNELAVRENKTVYYARALRGGKAARVFRVRPEIDPCMRCLAMYQAENDCKFPHVPEDRSLPTIVTECNNPIRPGSGADLKLIAGLTSRIVLEDIQSPQDNNHWVWVSEELEGHPGKLWGSVESYQLPKHPHCPVCNPSAVSPLLVSEDVLTMIRSECELAGDVETGGILMGFRVARDSRVAIVRATGPGPNAIRESTRFHRDVEYCQERLDECVAELGRHGGYVGEWHYHPAGPATPSGRDLLSLAQIAAQDEYAVEMPVMILAAPGEVCATVHPSGREHSQVDFVCAPLEEILSQLAQ